ncbi:HPr family phosphocarrier protein [Streptomyces sp. CHA1]|uniref:HPr family phosphocarrier protein n=1 Tax=Streptomyces TaxID=1883 RepID=UPI0003C2E166|nr:MULTISPECIES: HPr family phosphocarrier protein [unclassified Streptomyces]QOZ98107.1 HPr family phosphocarrier protein [Streptomyces violascens]UYM25869.1 HPr family phosphocarrier protein [Streptomyces albus]WDV30503.1 HPr family phosphocarrier protein [Streptomyces sp. AD16]WSB23882.1 HPr family phosphocarrier protein [Streptomyces albidoflavus]ESQ07625.1 Phosphotransferase system, phosphocarrier protein HPr [Streptomyces sp. PVA_94-07]
MPERNVVIGSSSGLHARPASLFVQAAARQPVAVSVGRPGERAIDARSMLSVLALGAKHGETLVLAAEGEGADAALDELTALVAADHDATESA